MSLSIQELVSDVTQLVSLPEICIRVTEMVEDPEATIADIGELISQDPALTTKILKIANSAMYGFRTEIDTVPRAITMLGTRQIRDLVLATSASGTFSGIPNSLISMEDFWYHSIHCGLAANQIARICGIPNADGLFVAGLLHDVGQLVMFNRLPDLSQQALLLSMEGPGEIEMYEAETEVFGYNHSQVGAALARSWNLPSYIRCCMEFHHQPENADEFKNEVSIVHVANSVAVLAELNIAEAELGPPLSSFAIQQLNLDTAVFPSVIDQIEEEFSEVESLLMPIDG